MFQQRIRTMYLSVLSGILTSWGDWSATSRNIKCCHVVNSRELNALATTTMSDFVKRLSQMNVSSAREVLWSKLITVFWGLLAISFALMADLFDNLIEVVNILGSYSMVLFWAYLSAPYSLKG